MSLKNAISRHIQGPRHDMKLLEGFWFKPRKYGYAGREQIDEVVRKMKRAIVQNPVALKVMSRFDMEKVTTKEIIKQLSEEELNQLYSTLSSADSKDADLTTELVRLQLLNGIGENNFKDESGAGVVHEGVDDAVVRLLMEDNDVVSECLEVVTKHNLPLGVPTESSSMT